jgi:hypothetical protein
MKDKFDKENFAEKIKLYLEKKITAHELYMWNCGFLDEKIEDQFLNKVWATIHRINEINPDFQTTEEELSYLFECLVGKKEYSDREFNESAMKGINRRFGKFGRS